MFWLYLYTYIAYMYCIILLLLHFWLLKQATLWRRIETKELKLRPATDVHDYQVKLRAAQKFLSKGARVKLTLQFKGREMEFKEIGREMFARFVEDLGGADAISIEQAAQMQGRQMNMVIGPKKEVI